MFSKKAFFFAVDASAILLAIHFQPFGGLDSLLPSLPKIPVKERDPIGLAQAFSHRSDEFMFLKLALQECCAEIVEFSSFGNNCSGFQAIVVTIIAALLFPEYDALQKGFYLISLLVDDLESDDIRIGLQRFFSPEAFLVGVDVAIVKEAHNLEILGAEDLQRVDGARRTANVKKDFSGHDAYPSKINKDFLLEPPRSVKERRLPEVIRSEGGGPLLMMSHGQKDVSRDVVVIHEGIMPKSCLRFDPLFDEHVLLGQVFGLALVDDQENPACFETYPGLT